MRETTLLDLVKLVTQDQAHSKEVLVQVHMHLVDNLKTLL